MTCLFCKKVEKVIIENSLALAFYDEFPVSPGHLLIIPKRHAENFFELTMEEKVAVDELIGKAKALLDEEFSPDGYNIGTNSGDAAGQSIFHCHIHLIPRYNGDVENPRGGVRGVIPSKMSY